MKNITVTMPDDVAQWARVQAAKQGMSVSRMISTVVERLMRESDTYDVAMRRYLSRERGELGGAASYPAREQLHERGGATCGRER